MKSPVRIWIFVSLLAACGGSTGGAGAGTGGSGASPPGGTGGGPATGGGGGSGAGGSTRADTLPLPSDLCQGLIQDKQARPMTTLAKPALGQTVTDAEFGTRIRRITAVAATGDNPVSKPMYSTIPAWNADESRLILYQVDGGHQLYDGKTYAFIRALDISPADLEQVYWHTSDPDILFYVDGKDFVRYHVAADRQEVLTTFSFCSGSASGGDDPMFMSFDANRIGLTCGNQVFIYEVSSNSVLARKTLNENPPQMAASGQLGFLSDTGKVVDPSLNVLRTLDLVEPYGHAGIGRLPTGEDTWNGHVYDPGPGGNDDIGSVVTWDLGKGTSRVIIGPKTGWPYPPGGHISAVAIRQPGWVFLSTQGGGNTGKTLLDMELVIANTATGTVCRAGRHRSFGKDNTKLADAYWAEAHNVPSPSGTRILFGSDWMNGATVDAYVVELPSYVP
jgi:hypothetical protein